MSDFDLCKTILSCFDREKAETLKPKRSSALICCDENVPKEYICSAINKNKTELSNEVEQSLLPLLNSNKYKHVIKALQNSVARSQINGDVYIGGMPCLSFVSQTTINIVSFLSTLASWVIQNTQNKDGKAYIEGFNVQWIESLNVDNISVICPDFTGINSKISFTIEKEDFRTVFTEIATHQSSLLHTPNSFKCYSLSFNESGFSYAELNDFLLENIGKYIYSRIDHENICINPKKYSTLAAKALTKLRDHHTEEKNEIGEFLVYSFLEGALQAPKIFSRYEIEENEHHNSKIYYSSGIHLLSYKADGKTKHQFVMGCYSINGTITSAIDVAIEKLKKIISRDNLIEEHKMINSFPFQNNFDSETSAFLKKLIAPTTAGQRPAYENAFGIFIGYSHNYKGSELEDAYQEKIIHKVKKDILQAIPYIEKKIEEIDLASKSVYFYFLPFNDALHDMDVLYKTLVQ